MKRGLMNRGLLALALLACSQVTTTWADTPTSDTNESQKRLNITKINSIIQKMIAETIKGDKIIKALDLELDPKKTDLAENKIWLKASATSRTTPWSLRKDTTLGLEVGFAATVKGSRSDVLVRLGASLKSDIPGLIRLLAEKQLKKESDRAPENENERKALDILEQLASLKKTEELVSIVEQARELAIKEFNETSAETQEAIREAERDGDAERVAMLKRNLERNQKDIEAFLAVKFPVKRDRKGKFLGIEIVADKPFRFGKSESFTGAELAPLKAQIADKIARVSFDLRFETKTEYVEEFGKVAYAYLSQLEGENQEEVESMRKVVAGWLELAKGALTGEDL